MATHRWGCRSEAALHCKRKKTGGQEEGHGGGAYECSPKPLVRELCPQKWWFFLPMPAPWTRW
jgi:hypothetical protein